MNEHREKLEDIIRQGVAVDLFHADEAFSLDMFVGQQANEFNKASRCFATRTAVIALLEVIGSLGISR